MYDFPLEQNWPTFRGAMLLPAPYLGAQPRELPAVPGVLSPSSDGQGKGLSPSFSRESARGLCSQLGYVQSTLESSELTIPPPAFSGMLVRALTQGLES